MNLRIHCRNLANKMYQGFINIKNNQQRPHILFHRNLQNGTPGVKSPDYKSLDGVSGFKCKTCTQEYVENEKERLKSLIQKYRSNDIHWGSVKMKKLERKLAYYTKKREGLSHSFDGTTKLKIYKKYDIKGMAEAEGRAS